MSAQGICVGVPEELETLAGSKEGWTLLSLRIWFTI